MKKLLFLFPIVLLLTAGCNTQQAYNQTPTNLNPSSSPATIVSTSTLVEQITQQQAIEIASKDLGAGALNYQVDAYMQNNNWYVNFSPKQPPCTPPQPCAVINGGNIKYVINAGTGAIISKQFGQ